MDLTGNYDNEGYIDLMSQNLGFVINLKKSILQPVKKLEFLGLQINTEEMILSLKRETDFFAFKSIAFKNQQINLVLSAVSWDHNYCRIFINEIECPNRLGVSECQGSLRLETAAKHISEHNQIFWISNSESLSIQAVPSTSTICSMQARSNQHSSRCNVTVLELHVSIRFPPFQSDKSNSEKGPSRKGGANDNSCTNMSVRDVNVMPTVVDTTARSTARSSRK